MKKEVRTYKAVYVEWLDSCSRKQTWWSTGDLIDDTSKPKDIFQTVAYLVNQNKYEYIFANSIHFEENKAVSLGMIFSIPKGAVLKMKNVTI